MLIIPIQFYPASNIRIKIEHDGPNMIPSSSQAMSCLQMVIISNNKKKKKFVDLLH